MNTFYFNTGVTPYGHANPPMKLSKGQVWRNGTKQIPFKADAPENVTLLFLSDNPNCTESKIENVIVRPVFDTTICSKYAYFRVNGITLQ